MYIVLIDQQINTAISTDDKITEIYFLVDDFLKLFSDQTKNERWQIAIFLERETIIEYPSIFVFKVEKINNISFYKNNNGICYYYLQMPLQTFLLVFN